MTRFALLPSRRVLVREISPSSCVCVRANPAGRPGGEGNKNEGGVVCRNAYVYRGRGNRTRGEKEGRVVLQRSALSSVKTDKSALGAHSAGAETSESHQKNWKTTGNWMERASALHCIPTRSAVKICRRAVQDPDMLLRTNDTGRTPYADMHVLYCMQES